MYWGQNDDPCRFFVDKHNNKTAKMKKYDAQTARISKLLPLIVLLIIACHGVGFCWDLGAIKDAVSLSGADNLAEKAIIGKFVIAFKKDRPISTSIDDAYPKAPEVKSVRVQDDKTYPVSRKMMEDLRRDGHIWLNPGVYDFYLQSFCLHAGKSAPRSDGAGYLIAPLKGSQAQVIKHILQNYPRFAGVTQMQAQYLIWSIEVGCKYGDLPPEEQAVAVKILPKEDLKSLGKSFWDVLPKSVRDRLFSELKEQLPDDVRDVLETYNDIQSKIADSKCTYEELESIAVKLDDTGDQKQVVDLGAWYDPGKGYYLRIFPRGFTQTKVQVYIPKESGDPDFNPADDIGAPAYTNAQRLGFGSAGTGEGGYSDDDGSGSSANDDSTASNNSTDNSGDNSGDSPHDPQKIQDAIDNAIKNVPDWHSQYGDHVCNIFVADIDSNLGYNEFTHSDGTPFTANEINDYVSNSPDWVSTKDPAEAQNRAKDGNFVIGSSKNTDSSMSGHVVAVDPFGDLLDSGHANGRVPNVYDANYADTPSGAGYSWQYNDGPNGGPNTPTWFYRK